MERMMAPSQRCRGRRRGPAPALAVAAALIVGTVACATPDPGADGPELGRREFVEVVVALREAELAIPSGLESDSAGAIFEARKREILEAHGTTEAALRRFVDRHHARPGRLAEVWDTIAQRLRHDPPAEPASRRRPVVEEAEGG